MTACVHGMPTPASCFTCMEDGVVTPERVEPETIDYTFEAQFDGECPVCESPTSAGERLAKTTRDRYVHPRCGRVKGQRGAALFEVVCGLGVALMLAVGLSWALLAGDAEPVSSTPAPVVYGEPNDDPREGSVNRDGYPVMCEDSTAVFTGWDGGIALLPNASICAE